MRVTRNKSQNDRYVQVGSDWAISSRKWDINLEQLAQDSIREREGMGSIRTSIVLGLCVRHNFVLLSCSFAHLISGRFHKDALYPTQCPGQVPKLWLVSAEASLSTQHYRAQAQQKFTSTGAYRQSRPPQTFGGQRPIFGRSAFSRSAVAQLRLPKPRQVDGKVLDGCPRNGGTLSNKTRRSGIGIFLPARL